MFSLVAQVLFKSLHSSGLGDEEKRKKGKYRKRGPMEGRERLVMLFICWSDSSPTYLIRLFVIKNYSLADIINLPTQPYTLNGALQTSEKEMSSRLVCEL